MPSVKGKEKAIPPHETEGEHGSTLFVSSIPFSTTSKELEAVFAEFAPVRHAFVVTHKDSKSGETRGKGVGIVAFAVREDAEDVMSRFADGEETLKISGRTLHLEWAKKRHSSDAPIHPPSKPTLPKPEPDSKPAPPTSSSKPSQPPKNTHAPTTSTSLKKPPTKSTDPVAKRTIVLSNLPTSTTDKSLWKKVRKLPGAESVSFPLEGEPGVAHAVFHDEKQTANAVARLDGSTFKGAEIGAVGLAEGGKTKTKSNSLIIRNLPRKITEDDLRAVFSPYGTIKSISLPTSTNASRAPPRFAFVWMTRRSDAEAAVKALNGVRMKVGGQIVFGKPKPNVDGVKKEEEEEVELKNDGSRVVAVDFAMSKSRWEEAKRNAMDVDEEEVKDEEDEDEDVKEEEEDDEEVKSEEEDDEMDVDDSDSNTSEEEEAD
ncbi:RNA recognition motif-containing protein, partial [Tulasnella sp. 427]